MLMGDRAAVPWPEKHPTAGHEAAQALLIGPSHLQLHRVSTRARQAKSPSVYDFRVSGPW